MHALYDMIKNTLTTLPYKDKQRYCYQQAAALPAPHGSAVMPIASTSLR